MKINQATVSKNAVSGKCTFKCQKCSFTSLSWNSLATHSKRKHNEILKMSEFEQYVTVVHVYVCKICSEKVLCDNQFLQHHFKGKHGYNLTEYREKFDCNAEKKELENNTKTKINEASVLKNSATGKCTFKCQNCDLTSNAWNEFKKHAMKKHNVALKMKDFVQYATTLYVYHCKICFDKVVSDFAFLTSHFISHHSMTLTQYRRKFDCKETLKETYFKVLETGRLSANQIGDLCTFKCPKCSRVFPSSHKFTLHCSKENCALKYERTTFGKYRYIAHVVVHKCKICSKLLLCDRTTIRSHVRSISHKIKTLEEYATKTGCVLSDIVDN